MLKIVQNPFLWTLDGYDGWSFRWRSGEKNNNFYLHYYSEDIMNLEVKLVIF